MASPFFVKQLLLKAECSVFCRIFLRVWIVAFWVLVVLMVFGGHVLFSIWIVDVPVISGVLIK